MRLPKLLSSRCVKKCVVKWTLSQTQRLHVRHVSVWKSHHAECMMMEKTLKWLQFQTQHQNIPRDRCQSSQHLECMTVQCEHSARSVSAILVLHSINSDSSQNSDGQWPRSGSARTLVSRGRRLLRDQVSTGMLRGLLGGPHDPSKDDFAQPS